METTPLMVLPVVMEVAAEALLIIAESVDLMAAMVELQVAAEEEGERVLLPLGESVEMVAVGISWLLSI
jgi:hypothetical protein